MAAPTAFGKINWTRGDIDPEEFHSDTGNGTWARRISYGSTGAFTVRASAVFSNVPSANNTAFSTNSVDFISPPWARGLQIYVDTSLVTSATSGNMTLSVEIQGKDPVFGNYVSLSSGTWLLPSSSGVAGFNGTTGTASLQIYPGIPNTSGRSVSGIVPGVWRAVTTAAGSSVSVTFTIAAQYEP